MQTSSAEGLPGMSKYHQAGNDPYAKSGEQSSFMQPVQAVAMATKKKMSLQDKYGSTVKGRGTSNSNTTLVSLH